MAGRHLCARRYREFANLHQNLKKEFPDFHFPKMPGKWPFTLTDQQLDSRRRGLEQYLEKVCAIRVIAESEAMQEFLTDFDDESGTSITMVDLKVLLPDKSIATVSVKKNSTTVDVYLAVVDKIGMSPVISQYFALFEIVEYGFERKLQANEFPHNLYIQNYSTASSTCLVIRKWIFSLTKERELSTDELAERFFFYQVSFFQLFSIDCNLCIFSSQAIEDVNQECIQTLNQLYELKALQDYNKCKEYLKLVRSLEGYNEIRFPHCACDAKKEGHIIAIVGICGLKLQACREDGVLENQMIRFDWDEISNWEVDDEGLCFVFQYCKPERKSRSVRIHTPYFVYMNDCFNRINEERNKSNYVTLSNNSINSNNSSVNDANRHVARLVDETSGHNDTSNSSSPGSPSLVVASKIQPPAATATTTTALSPTLPSQQTDLNSISIITAANNNNDTNDDPPTVSN